MKAAEEERLQSHTSAAQQQGDYDDHDDHHYHDHDHDHDLKNDNKHKNNNHHEDDYHHHHTSSPSLASLLNPTYPPSSSSSSSPTTTFFYHQHHHRPSLPSYPPTQQQPSRIIPFSLQTPRLSEPSVDRPFKRTKLTPDHPHHPHLSRSNTPERFSQSPQSISTTITLHSNEDRPQPHRPLTSLNDLLHSSSLGRLPPPIINSDLPSPILKQHRSFSTPTHPSHPSLSSGMIDPHHYHHPNPIISTDYHHHPYPSPSEHGLQPAHPINNPHRPEKPNSKRHHPYPTRTPIHSNPVHDQRDPSSSSSSSSSSRASTTASTTTATTLTIQSHLEESIFGIAPYDDFTWTVAQFIWKHSQPYWERGEGHLIEVEAKLGTIRDKRNQGDRMYYPIGTETPILDTRDTRFETDVSVLQHESLNRLLNQRVTETNLTGYTGPKVEYTHTKEVDEFYDPKIRVTRDCRNNHHPSAHIPPNKSIVKEKLAHLDIHCPGRPFDFRVSVNVEKPVPLPPEHATPNFKRVKDRVSYSHQICQVDLTQVKSSEQNGISTHEVEVEFRNSNELLRAASVWSTSNSDPASMADSSERGNSKPRNGEEREGSREEDNYHAMAGDRGGGGENRDADGHQYLLMVEVLLNNVRMLIRNC